MRRRRGSRGFRESTLIGIEIDFGNRSGMMPGEVGERVKTGGKAFHVALPGATNRAEQAPRRASRRSSPRRRHHAAAACASAKSRIDLDGHAAHAESERQAEIGIARHAGEHLDAVGDEFLHQERGIGRPRIASFSRHSFNCA